MKAPRLFQKLTKSAVIPPLLIILTVVLPLVSSLVTYAFVSLPDNSISLDLTGSLLLLLVLFKILILGSLGTFPIDLNAVFNKRKGRRAARHLMDGALVDDLPCTVRILCELETTATPSSVDDRGQTLEDGDRVEGTLLDIDHIGLYQEAAVLTLFG
ncbi:uncharacterized protein LOC135216202 [Macrobrachium nipponense]|uniref:uncharacterized protein LOC135216202 n=1 Tax=Macrobrachium nipponense TaxID=159736 RepID=UPI0030C85A2A